MFKSSMFPNSLKLAGLTLLHKKGRKELNEDYRSVSILPTFSKIFKRIKFAQISRFFDNVFSKYQCGFWKGYRTQHSKKMEKCAGKGKVSGALLTDLPKIFDCLKYNYSQLIRMLTSLIF